jgi:hypothetical protein
MCSAKTPPELRTGQEGSETIWGMKLTPLWAYTFFEEVIGSPEMGDRCVGTPGGPQLCRALGHSRIRTLVLRFFLQKKHGVIHAPYITSIGELFDQH